MSPLTKWLLFVVGLIILGCGGGGGGGVVAPTNVTLTGRVVWVGTGGPPNPVASVRVGTTSVATDAFDGFFEIPAPSGTDQVIVTYSPSTGSPVIQTFTFTAATANRDLGDLYIGPETVSVRGRAVSSSGGAAIAGGAVTFAGRSATTDASGVFILTQVAYDPASQAGGQAYYGQPGGYDSYGDYGAGQGFAGGGSGNGYYGYDQRAFDESYRDSGYGYRAMPVTDAPTADNCSLAESPIYLPDGRVQKRFVRVCRDARGEYQVVD